MTNQDTALPLTEKSSCAVRDRARKGWLAITLGTLLGCSALGAGAAATAPPYSVIDVGALNPDFPYSTAHAINDAGHVVGHSYARDWSGWHAFCWKDRNGDGDNLNDLGELIDLGSHGGNWSDAEGISPVGQYVVGNFGKTDAAGNEVARGFRWNDADGDHVVDADREITTLSPPEGGRELKALGVNDHGQVVGWYLGTDGRRRAFLWTDTSLNGVQDPGELLVLGDLGSGFTQSEAHAINNSGQVVGYTNIAIGERAFLFSDNGNNEVDAGECRDLGTLIWDPVGQQYHDWSRAADINEAGQVTGWSATHTATGTAWVAFLWTDNDGDGQRDPAEMVNLDGRPAPDGSRGRRLSGSGDAVGWSYNQARNLQPALFSQGGIQILTDLVPNGFAFMEPWRDHAVDINASGRIAATGWTNATGAQFHRAHVLVRHVAPTAVDQTVSGEEDFPIEVQLQGSGTPGAQISFEITGQPRHGRLEPYPGVANQWLYVPEANFNGADSFTYRVSDGQLTSADAKVSITVEPYNDAPVPVADSYTIAEDGVLTVPAPGVLGNDSDVEGDALTVYRWDYPSGGGFQKSAADGSFTFVPHPNFHGTAHFYYQLTDGVNITQPIRAEITVTPVNDVPVTTSPRVATYEQVATQIQLSGSDVDGDALDVAIETAPARGTLTGAGWQWTYTANKQASNVGTDSFTFRVSDRKGGIARGTVSISILKRAKK